MVNISLSPLPAEPLSFSLLLKNSCSLHGILCEALSFPTRVFEEAFSLILASPSFLQCFEGILFHLPIVTGKRKEKDWRNASGQEKEPKEKSKEKLKAVLDDRTRAGGAEANIV